MTNPFAADDARFLVLVNDGREHSLWREDLPVPAGWTRVLGPVERQACLDFVEARWTELHPTPVGAARPRSEVNP